MFGRWHSGPWLLLCSSNLFFFLFHILDLTTYLPRNFCFPYTWQVQEFPHFTLCHDARVNLAYPLFFSLSLLFLYTSWSHYLKRCADPGSTPGLFPRVRRTSWSVFHRHHPGHDPLWPDHISALDRWLGSRECRLWRALIPPQGWTPRVVISSSMAAGHQSTRKDIPCKCALTITSTAWAPSISQKPSPRTQN